MNGADYAILGVLALSALISVLRGFVKEALSLLSWVLALWVALGFAEEMAGLLRGWISLPSARTAAAFVILFLSVLMLGALVNHLAVQLVRKTGLGGADRLLGAVFGVLRGALIVAVLVLLAGLTALPQDPWWRQSRMLGLFQGPAMVMRGFLPPEIAAYIRYD